MDEDDEDDAEPENAQSHQQPPPSVADGDTASPMASGAAFYEGPSGSSNHSSGSGGDTARDAEWHGLDAEIRTVAREESEATDAAIRASLEDRGRMRFGTTTPEEGSDDEGIM